jgi:hypothetical protein
VVSTLFLEVLPSEVNLTHFRFFVVKHLKTATLYVSDTFKKYSFLTCVGQWFTTAFFSADAAARLMSLIGYLTPPYSVTDTQAAPLRFSDVTSVAVILRPYLHCLYPYPYIYQGLNLDVEVNLQCYYYYYLPSGLSVPHGDILGKMQAFPVEKVLSCWEKKAGTATAIVIINSVPLLITGLLITDC